MHWALVIPDYTVTSNPVHAGSGTVTLPPASAQSVRARTPNKTALTGARSTFILGRVTRTSTRLAPLDALRGLIMLVMALDHANLFIAHGHPRAEMWAGSFPTYTDPVAFLTRAVTHLAAPGFFWLMGAGMILLAYARRNTGWSEGRIARFLVTRGALLIFLQLLVEDPAWIWGSGGTFSFWNVPVYLGVLYGLGGAMILGTLLLRLDWRVLLGVSAGLLLGAEVVIRFFAADALRYLPWTQLLLLPGSTPSISVLYPLLPWLGVTAFGMAFGHWLIENAERAYRRAFLLGIAFLTAFAPLRALNGFGNIRAAAGGDWIAFLNNVKYPPSITFLLLALGIDLTLLFALSRRALSILTRPLSPLIVFGTTPLFFYLAHLYLYGFIGRTFFPGGTPNIPAMYPYWLLGLVILYPLCCAYDAFKRTRAPDSLWRLF